MKLWHVHVGPGRFIVRAEDEKHAISLARSEAENYFATREEAHEADAGADPLSTEGPVEVLDVDFS
jgi:hypothetical protein